MCISVGFIRDGSEVGVFAVSRVALSLCIAEYLLGRSDVSSLHPIIVRGPEVGSFSECVLS